MNKRKINILSDEQKMTVQLWLGVILAASGIILLAVSFCVPPLGVIDASVLAAVGEVFTFSGALIGIDYSYKYKQYKHRNERQYINPHGDAYSQSDAEPIPVDETGEYSGEDEDRVHH